MEKILIIQTGFLGDAVLASSVLWALKGIELEVGLLVRKEFEEVFSNHKRVNFLHLLDKKSKNATKNIINELRQIKYNYTVVPHRSFRSSYIAKHSNIRYRAGFRKSAGSFLFNHKVEYNILEHETQRNLSLLREVLPKKIFQQIVINSDLEGNNTSNISRHILQAKTWLSANLLPDNMIPELKTANKPIVCVAPGSVWETKRWKVDGFIALVKLLIEKDFSVCLIGSPNEVKITRTIYNNLNEQQQLNCVDFAGKISLSNTISLINNSEIVITNDSAPLHIAESLGKPVIAIFGATVPEFGFAPLLKNSNVVQVDLPCRPCGIHGSKLCPIKTFSCMNLITPEMIIQHL